MALGGKKGSRGARFDVRQTDWLGYALVWRYRASVKASGVIMKYRNCLYNTSKFIYYSLSSSVLSHEFKVL